MPARRSCFGIVFALLLVAGQSAVASSHMDAPLITLDDAANTTDVYAFVSERNGVRHLSTALAVYPFEEPGIGPNKYNFGDGVLYEIHLAVGDDLAAGRTSIAYQFQFSTGFKNRGTILQSYTCEVKSVGDECQNLLQTYRVTQVDYRGNRRRPRITELQDISQKTLMVPPNNQGRLTRLYNQNDDGDMPAKPGVDSPQGLDPFTQQTVYELDQGHQVFAGQRDDGFYADIQSIFDLDFSFSGPSKPFDSQGGFNVHTIALNIPTSLLGDDTQVVGVYATTSRRRVRLEKGVRGEMPLLYGDFVQIGRQGNPLFCEGLVGIEDKDLYNRTSPETDQKLFSKYAKNVQLAAVLSGLLGQTINPDLSFLFIPDLIKVDLTTPPARLAGGGSSPGAGVPADDQGFSRLGAFGGDSLASRVGSVLGNNVTFGGWPNGRRFGDDVVDIAVVAILALGGFSGDLPTNLDKVTANDIAYNKVFPYAATPHNGRSHQHH
jgi:hypothetical protein